MLTSCRGASGRNLTPSARAELGETREIAAAPRRLARAFLRPTERSPVLNRRILKRLRCSGATSELMSAAKRALDACPATRMSLKRYNDRAIVAAHRL